MSRQISYFITACKKLYFRLAAALLYKDKKLRKQKLKDWTTKAEKKYLKRYLYALDKKPEPAAVDEEKIIWVCWLQGEEKAPEVVKICLNSIRKNCRDYKIIVLTNENIKDYADIPDYIYEKKARNLISNTHFSDILRLSLLQQHGGIWIDATVLLTAPLPEKLMAAPVFALHCRNIYGSNNWLLKSKPAHPLICGIRNLLLEYWKHENRLINYFVYHILFDLMVEENKAMRDEWDKVPVLYDGDCYDLEQNFLNPFDKGLYDKICKKTTIHKLSYKYKKDKPLTGTFLEKLLNGELFKNA